MASRAEVVSSIHMIVTLEDAPGGGTLMTVRQRFPSRKMRDTNMEMGAEAGWTESFVKLDVLLASL